MGKCKKNGDLGQEGKYGLDLSFVLLQRILAAASVFQLQERSPSYVGADEHVQVHAC